MSTEGIQIKRSLTCVSNNNNYIHSLQKKQHRRSQTNNTWCIITTTYPNNDNDDNPIETILPESISHYLTVDDDHNAPIELLLACNNNNNSSGGTSTNNIVLCLYTSKSIYLITLNNDDDEFDIIDIEEPLEINILRTSLEEQDISIIRVRHPNTTTNNNSITLYPNNSLLVLLSNGSLVVYHPTLKASSMPVVMNNDIIEDMENDKWVDFVIDNNNTVFYLSLQGYVYTASPIVIDAMMVPKWKIDTCIEKCYTLIESLSQDNTNARGNNDLYKQAQIHRLKAEKQFYTDIFVSSDDNNPDFLKCRYRASNENQSACLWPILLQGPLVYGISSNEEPLENNDHNKEEACFIEVLTNDDQNGSALGLVIAYTNGRVDIVYLSRAVEVRFGIESEDDKNVLNDRIIGQSAVVERIQMDTTTTASSSVSADSSLSNNKPIMLKVEQDGTMIHYADQSGVFTITTNVASVMKGTEKEIDSKAWPCVTLSNSTTNAFTTSSLIGVDIIQSADLGHVLITKFSNGSIDVVNLTAALYMTTYPLLSPPPPPKQQSTTTTSSSSSVLPPTLLEQITPLINTIQKTRSVITTLIDSTKLKPKEADASTIATLLYYRNIWEKGYILPLLQLEKLMQYRIPTLTTLASRQSEQLNKLSLQIDTLKNSYEKSLDLSSTLDTNATILSNRSASLLETSHELSVPNITKAEMQYFDFITNQAQLYDTNKKQISDIKVKLNKFKSLEHLEYNLDLNTEQKDMTNDLLSGNDVKLQTSLENVRLVKKDLDCVRREIESNKKQ